LDKPSGDVTADWDSDGTDGSERMRQNRDLCSEEERDSLGSSSSSEDDDDDDDDDINLFPSDASSVSDSEPEEPDLPVPTPAGYLFIDPHDGRSRFARVTTFRGQRSCRCYKHPGCSWLLPVGSTIPVQNQIRWAVAGLRPEVVTKEQHLRMRPEFSAGPL
jgi:hypothetical protein